MKGPKRVHLSGNAGYPSNAPPRTCRRSSYSSRSSSYDTGVSNFANIHTDDGIVDARWVSAFRKLKFDGEVHKDSLPELLKLVGHHKPDAPAELLLLTGIANHITSYSSLEEMQVYEFIRKYEADLHRQLREHFSAVAEEHGGKVPVSELEVLVTRKGYTPLPHALREILGEVAAELGENTDSGVSFKAFVGVMHVLEGNEGFCTSDLLIFESAFQRFDTNKDGKIEMKQLRALLESYDFFVDPALIEKLVSHFLEASNGHLSFKDFLCISRKRVQLEFDTCHGLFEECDSDKDGLLHPGELMRMALKLGVSLLPETLIDLMDECGVEGSNLDYQGVWKMLQVLRAREGFTQSEAADIRAVFNRFDSSCNGEMPLKRVPAAILWLGYPAGPGVIGKANKQVQIPDTGSSYMTDSQFLRLARKHHEAQLKCIRKVFRTFAADGGAGKLRMENLQAAILRLNRLFVNDFLEWVKLFRPGARLARKHVLFDFEEFRKIVLQCWKKARARSHRHCGFAEVELSRLRIEFVKHTKDDASALVDAAGCQRLLKVLIPEIQTVPTVHDRVKKAVDSEHGHSPGLDWHGFLRVMMVYGDLTEVHYEKRIRACIEELNLPDQCIDDAKDILRRMCQGDNAQSPLTPKEMQFLAQGLSPQLTEEEAGEALERVLEETGAMQGEELSGLTNLRSIVLGGNLSQKKSNTKAHDMGSTF